MPFVLISRKEFAKQFLRNNPTVARAEIESGLAHAIAARQRGERCSCGNPLWVAGSAIAGLACFTCITGEADPDTDYEIE
jgi:hypothetical protein